MAAALAHHRAGRLRQAENHYRRIIERVPGDPVAGFFLAIVARHRGQPTASNAAMDAPGPAEAFVNQGNALLKQGQAAAALTCHQQALALKPALAAAHCGLGNALQHLDRREEAISHYRQALELQWDLSAAHNNLGSALRRQGQPDEAIACYRRALALSPNLAATHNNLGNTYGEQNRWAEAIACYEQAVQLRPDSAKDNPPGARPDSRGEDRARDQR